MLDTTTILFLSLNLMTLGASRKGNHTVSVPVWRAYFTEHTVLRSIHAAACCQHLLPSFPRLRNIPLCAPITLCLSPTCP